MKGSYKRKNTIYFEDLDQNKFSIIKYSKDPSHFKIAHNCEICKKEIITSLKNIRRRLKENIPFICQSCNKAGERNPSYNKNPYRSLSDERREKLKKIKSKNAIKNELSKKGYLASVHNKESSIHLKVKEILKSKNLDFQSEYNIENYFFDECSITLNKIIEIHGDYFHANPEIYNPNEFILGPWKNYLARDKWEYDEKRIQTAKNYGFDVLVLWENEINSSIKDVEKKIDAFLKFQ